MVKVFVADREYRERGLRERRRSVQRRRYKERNLGSLGIEALPAQASATMQEAHGRQKEARRTMHIGDPSSIWALQSHHSFTPPKSHRQRRYMEKLHEHTSNDA